MNIHVIHNICNSYNSLFCVKCNNYIIKIFYQSVLYVHATAVNYAGRYVHSIGELKQALVSYIHADIHSGCLCDWILEN